MSERRSDNSGTGPSEGRREHERDQEEFQAATGYQPATNQARDEPLPASHHDDERQEAGRRSGEPVRDDPADRGQADRAQASGGQAVGRPADSSGRGQSSHDEKGQDS